MPHCSRWFLTGLTLAACSIVGAQTNKALERMTPVAPTEPIPVLDFFRPSLFNNPELNAAGTHFFAWTTMTVDRSEIVVCDIASRRFDRLRPPRGGAVAAGNWLGNDHLIFSVYQEVMPFNGLHVASVTQPGQSHGVDYRNSHVFLSAPRSAPHHPLIWIRHSSYLNGQDLGVVQIDALEPRSDTFSPRSTGPINLRSPDNGTLAKVVRSYPSLKHGKTVGYLTDAAGELAYGLTTLDGKTHLHRLDGPNWRPCPVDLDEIEIVAVSDDPGRLLVLGPRQEGRPRALQFLDTETGQPGEVLLQDENFDPARSRVYRHPADGRILGVRFEREFPTTVWFDAGYQRLQRKIENSLDAANREVIVTILGSDRAERRFLVAVWADRRPTSYLMINIDQGTIVPVVESTAPWLDPDRLRPMTFFTYKNRDGVPIDAFLTLPEGASKAKPAPLVVLPHGSPWVRNSWGYDVEVQFLASRGYAVFQPNYRGSLGTQWRFPVEDLWVFRKMHDDVTDGVRRMIRSGLIDPDRIAIMGTSFGGYLSLSGVAHEPDLYRCAVAMSGVYDWATMTTEARRFESDGVRSGRTATLRGFLGDPKTQGEKFDEFSPVRFVDRIRAPVFIAHGSADKVTSVEQSQRLIAQLKRHRVPHETHIVRGKGHDMAALENRVKLYTAVEAFLATHLAPRAAAARDAAR